LKPGMPADARIALNTGTQNSNSSATPAK